MKTGFVSFPAWVLAFCLVFVHVSGASCQGCDPENRVSTATLVPPDYAGFQPPPEGQSYVDPMFCTEIKRLTDSQAGYLTNSEQAFFNIDDSYFLASENNTGYLWDGHTGQRIKEIGGGSMRPWWIRWPRGNYYTLSGVKHTLDPTRHFYKYEGNEVRLYNVDTLDYMVLHKFTEYSEVGPAGGEGDVSLDGRYWVLDGTRVSDGKLVLFAYDFLDDRKGPEIPFDIGDVGGSGTGVDYATISPSGDYVIIAWDAGPSDPFNGHWGVEVFDRETWTYLRRVHPCRIHFDLGYDGSGHEAFFACAGNTQADLQTFGIPDLSAGDVVSVRLADGVGTKLLDIPNWADSFWSFAGGLNQYVFLALEQRSDPASYWAPYWGEILAIATDGSGDVVRLVHHRSRRVGSQGHYAYQPDFNVNNQGSKIVFHSTFGLGNCDLYLFDVPISGAGPVNPDLDSDGMPNIWEVQHGLNQEDPSDAAMDNDADGFTNLTEYEGDTDPNDPKLHPYLLVSGLGGSSEGWAEAFYGDYTQKGWLHVGWSSYTAVNGEARLATGDIDGDGKDEIVMGLGPVEGDSAIPAGWFGVLDDDHSHLGWGRIGWSGYNSSNGETWPACGDVDGDGVDEIIIGLGSGGSGWIEVFDYISGQVSHKAWVQVRWSAYRASDGEVRPACGDVDGDGRDEIVVGLGSSGSGWFEVFDDGVAGYGHLSWSKVSWNAYNNAHGESRPACGDIDGDGVDEIVMGLGSGGSGWFEVFEYEAGQVTHRDWVRVGYKAYNSEDGETRPVCGDLDGDGRDEIVVGLGQAGGGYMEVFDDASNGYTHLAWPRIHWQAAVSANGETWPGVKK
jgi:hypothetical protein